MPCISQRTASVSGSSFFGAGASLTYSGISTVTLYASEASSSSAIAVTPQLGMIFYINGDINLSDSLTVSGPVLDAHSGSGAASEIAPRLVGNVGLLRGVIHPVRLKWKNSHYRELLEETSRPRPGVLCDVARGSALRLR